MARLGVPYFYEEAPLIEMADACMAKGDNRVSICSFCSRMKRGAPARGLNPPVELVCVQAAALAYERQQHYFVHKRRQYPGCSPEYRLRR